VCQNELEWLDMTINVKKSVCMPGKRRQGGQKKQWIDDIVQWGKRSLVEMVRQAENRKGYRCLVHEAAYARTSGTAS